MHPLVSQYHLQRGFISPEFRFGILDYIDNLKSDLGTTTLILFLASPILYPTWVFFQLDGLFWQFFLLPIFIIIIPIYSVLLGLEPE